MYVHILIWVLICILFNFFFQPAQLFMNYRKKCRNLIPFYGRRGSAEKDIGLYRLTLPPHPSSTLYSMLLVLLLFLIIFLLLRCLATFHLYDFFFFKLPFVVLPSLPFNLLTRINCPLSVCKFPSNLDIILSSSALMATVFSFLVVGCHWFTYCCTM